MFDPPLRIANYGEPSTDWSETPTSRERRLPSALEATGAEVYQLWLAAV